jgi:hypothetical protein
MRRVALLVTLTWITSVLVVVPASAVPFSFSTGNPDGKIATGSRPSSAGKIEIESADDFILTSPGTLDHATFTGLIPVGASINQVRLEIYRVFPKDSQDPPSGNVPTRVNSPSDVAFQERDSSSGLSFSFTSLGAFSAANSVLNGINPIPNQTTGGEGPVSGTEIVIDVTLADPFVLPADHYFFVPQVELASGDFLWLSAPRPIVPPGTPFDPDLQSWIRNENLAPDWLRIGADIVGGTTFNATFSISGTVPAPAPIALLGAGLAVLGGLTWRRSAWSQAPGGARGRRLEAGDGECGGA